MDKQTFPQLRNSIHADVAIIGGGLSGMTIALWLLQMGLNVTVAEARTCGGGTTSKCRGVVCYSNSAVFSSVKKHCGGSALDDYWSTTSNAVQSVLQLARHVQTIPMKHFLYADSAKEADTLSAEAEMRKNVLKKTEIVNRVNTPVGEKNTLRVTDAFYFKFADYFQTLMTQAMINSIRIFENTRVLGLEREAVYTEQGKISAPYTVIATGFPILQRIGTRFLTLEQFAVVSARFTGGEMNAVWNSVDGKVRFLETGGETEVLIACDVTQKNVKSVEQIGRQLSTKPLPIEEQGVECYTADHIPYIGVVSRKHPNTFIATGYGGNGIVGSMLAAQAISTKILGLNASAYELYSPQRRTLSVQAALKCGSRYIKNIRGGSGAPRCTHMGCKLVYNKQTRLWECPCHGSRYDHFGNVINAPAVRPADLKARK